MNKMLTLIMLQASQDQAIALNNFSHTENLYFQSYAKPGQANRLSLMKDGEEFASLYWGRYRYLFGKDSDSNLVIEEVGALGSEHQVPSQDVQALLDALKNGENTYKNCALSLQKPGQAQASWHNVWGTVRSNSLYKGTAYVVNTLGEFVDKEALAEAGARTLVTQLGGNDETAKMAEKALGGTVRHRETLGNLGKAIQALEELSGSGVDNSTSRLATALLEALDKTRRVPSETPRSFNYERPAIEAQALQPLVMGNQLNLDAPEQRRIATFCYNVYKAERKRRQAEAQNPTTGTAVVAQYLAEKVGIDHVSVYGDIGDIAAFLYLDKEQNRLYVVMRGSLKEEGKDFLTDEDWKHNLQMVGQEPSRYGLSLPGDRYHGGFLQRYKKLQNSLYEGFRDLLGPMQNMNPLQIIVTGHSLGASQAQIAAADICSNILPKLYANFDNTRMNRVHCVPIAAPRVAGNKATQDALHNTIGKDNIFRLNVRGDFVPHGSMNTHTGEMIKNIMHSTAGYVASLDACDKVIDAVSGYESIGHLGIIYNVDAMKVNKKEITKQTFKLIENFVRQEKSLGIKSFLAALFFPFHNGVRQEEHNTTHYLPAATQFGEWQKCLQNGLDHMATPIQGESEDD